MYVLESGTLTLHDGVKNMRIKTIETSINY